MASSVECVWCTKPLVDRDHAMSHGPRCEKNPTRQATRVATLGDVADIAYRQSLTAPTARGA